MSLWVWWCLNAPRWAQQGSSSSSHSGMTISHCSVSIDLDSLDPGVFLTHLTGKCAGTCSSSCYRKSTLALVGRHKATQSLTSEGEYCKFYPILLVKAIQVDKHGIEGRGNIPCSFHKRNCKVTQQRTWIERNTESGPMMQSTTSGHLHLYRNSSGGSSNRGRYGTFIRVSQWSDLGSDTKLPIFCLLVQIFQKEKSDWISQACHWFL